jgi:class 3 adenylate cyclase/pimeloyl-ACP methyl ester carboxylesterase
VTDESRRTETVAVLFCDVVGSTARQSRLGDDVHDEFRRRYFNAMSDCVRASHGEVVKTMGDGVMAVFRASALDAILCAWAMHDAVEALERDDPVAIYVGVSAGEAAHEDGDWFGTPVNEAARLCAAAAPSQTLTTELVRGLIGNRGNIEFRSVGRLTLKGLSAPVSVVEPIRATRVFAPDTPTTPTRDTRPRIITRSLIAVTVLVAVAATATVVVVSRSASTSHSSSPRAPLTSARGYVPIYVTRRCPATVVSETPTATCGTLTVPQDRTRPHDGHVVHLLVTRVPARQAATLDPVVDFGADVLSGSPVRDNSEEIQLSTRGFAPSAPVLTCPDYTKIAPDELTRPLNDPTTKRLGIAALAKCFTDLERRGIDPRQYNYDQDGEDMLDLLRVLKLGRVHLVSGYVATIAALHVIHAAPDVVRSITLGDPVDPGTSHFSDPTAYLAAALDQYISLCQHDRACKALGNLYNAYKLGYQTYTKHPTITVGDDGNGHKHTVRIDGQRLAEAIAGALFDPSSIPLIATGIAQANTRTIDELTAGRVLSYDRQLLDSNFAWGTLLSRQCSYEAHTVQGGHALSSQTRPELAGIDAADLGTLTWRCTAWPVPPLPDSEFDDSREVDVPALIVRGALTPTTSPDWVVAISQHTFAHATIVRIPSVSADVLSDNNPPCLGDLRRAFISKPSAPLDPTSCEAKSPAINFVTNTPS